MIDYTLVMTVLGLGLSLGWGAQALLARKKNLGRRTELVSAWNAASATVGTHQNAVTRKAQAAITTKHLLAKIGSSANQVAIAGASDAPMHVMPDEAEAGDAIACEILVALDRTVRMLSADVITAGTQLASAANGRVRQLPVSAGTYYVVGRALTGAEGSGELVEVVSCVAHPVVVA